MIQKPARIVGGRRVTTKKNHTRPARKPAEAPCTANAEGDKEKADAAGTDLAAAFAPDTGHPRGQRSVADPRRNQQRKGGNNTRERRLNQRQQPGHASATQRAPVAFA
jgi:hypothetical protein